MSKAIKTAKADDPKAQALRAALRKATAPDAPVVREPVQLHPDDRIYASRIAETDRVRGSALHAAEYFDGIVMKLGGVVDYRAKLDPEIDCRAYLRALIQIAMVADEQIAA